MVGRNFNPKVTKRQPDTQSHEGLAAYTYEDARNELVAAVATTFLDDKFYERAEDRMDRVRSLVDTILDDGHSRFLWSLIRYTRDEWHLRSITHLLAGEYLLRPDLRTWKGDIDPEDILVDNVFIRPDDVTKVWGYWMTHNPHGGKSKMPRLLRRATNRWLNKLSPFIASKYVSRLEGHQLTMKRLIKMSHPKPKNEEQNRLFQMILEEKLESTADWTTEVTTAEVDEELGRELTPKEKWERALPKMSYMAVLKNLAAFDRAGVDPAKVLPKLTNAEAVRKSRVLPFRFVTAMEMVEHHYKQALATALDHSFDNFKLPPGRYLVAVDSSGSMTWAGRQETAPIQQAAMFGSILVNKAKQGGSHMVDLVMFDTNLIDVDHFGMNTMGLYNHIMSRAEGGGTFGQLVYIYANLKKEPYDYIFILTDMQYHDLVGSHRTFNPFGSTSPPRLALNFSQGKESFKQEAYDLARSGSPVGNFDTNQPDNAWIVNINLQGYSKTQTPFDNIQRRIIELPGISEKIFDYLEVVKDPQGLVDKITQS